MITNISSEIVSGLFAISGTVIGWILNEFTSSRREKPKLCFQLTLTPERELQDEDFRLDTSPSEYGIEIYNMGRNPFILDRFNLLSRKELIVDCSFANEPKTILPYKSIIYTLNEEEKDALEYHCREDGFEKCSVIAYDVAGKSVNGDLNVNLIAIRCQGQKNETIED